jgi:hypothetical protein
METTFEDPQERWWWHTWKDACIECKCAALQVVKVDLIPLT